MKDDKEIIESDYVSPPCYTDASTSSVKNEDPLIKRLQSRIQKDLNQINGIYENQIFEEKQKKRKSIEDIEREFDITVNEINHKRDIEISEYNDKAEKYIDTLISSMCNIPSTKSGNNHWIVDYVMKIMHIK